MSKCPTGKVQHADKEAATIALAKLRQKDPEGSVGVRPYVCPRCKKWHNGHYHKRAGLMDMLGVIPGKVRRKGGGRR